MRFQLDYSHMMADSLGLEQGLLQEQLTALRRQFERAYDELETEAGLPASRQTGFRALPDTMSGELSTIQTVADEMAAEADAHLILGIGGSYLGAAALFGALCHPYHNELSSDRRHGRPRIYFEGNSLDSDAWLGLSERLGEDPVTIHVVSKSGETLETAAAFRLARRLNVTGLAATTDAARGCVRPICRALGVPDNRLFVLPDNVGGRYSVLTAVGLLPAAIMGLNIENLLAGAAWMRKRCQVPDPLENPACLYAGLQHRSLLAGRDISVLSVWDKGLEMFGLWLDQLSAESLGKDGRGRTPLTAVCTRELHSRGQQHQQGTRNKVICNLIADEPRRAAVAVPAANGVADRLDGLQYLVAGQQTLHSMNEAAYRATDASYAKDQRPGMTIRIGRIDEEHLGALIYFFELATVLEGKLMGVNPLDQPGVQGYKDFLGALLGRQDARSEAFKQEYDARRAVGRPHSLNLS